MSHCTLKTSLRLKAAGLNEPPMEVDQIWYDAYGNASLLSEKMDGFFEVFLSGSTHVYETSDFEGWAYAPDLEYITAHLAPGFRLEMWDGRFSCSNGDDEYPMRSQADNFTEAAALIYLEKKKDNGFLG